MLSGAGTKKHGKASTNAQLPSQPVLTRDVDKMEILDIVTTEAHTSGGPTDSAPPK